MYNAVELTQKLIPVPAGGLHGLVAPAQVVSAPVIRSGPGQKITLAWLSPDASKDKIESGKSSSVTQQPLGSGQSLVGEKVQAPVLNCSKAKFIPAIAA